jgi:hypothetical protein
MGDDVEMQDANAIETVPYLSASSSPVSAQEQRSSFSNQLNFSALAIGSNRQQTSSPNSSGSATATMNGGTSPVVVVATTDDMGYEECAPQIRRGSMTHEQERERRASIKAVMADPNLSPTTKRRSIQHLMDGRRNSIETTNSSHNYPTTSRRRSSVAGTSVCSAASTTTSGYNNAWDNEGDNGGLNGSGLTPRRGSFLGMRRPSDDWIGSGNAEALGYDDFMVGGVIAFGATSGMVISNDQTRRTEQSRPHCPHYDRKCTMIAPCCGAAFGCRICHDECPALYVGKRYGVSLEHTS